MMWYVTTIKTGMIEGLKGKEIPYVARFDPELVEIFVANSDDIWQNFSLYPDEE